MYSGINFETLLESFTYLVARTTLIPCASIDLLYCYKVGRLAVMSPPVLNMKDVTGISFGTLSRIFYLFSSMDNSNPLLY